MITLARSSIEPFLTFSSRRDLREQAFMAWASRGDGGGATDNKAIIAEMVSPGGTRPASRLRDLRGFFKLDDTMAKTPENVLGPRRSSLPARARRRGARRPPCRGPGAGRQHRHRALGLALLRRARCAARLDEVTIKPFFQLDRPRFETAHRLFGLSSRNCRTCPAIIRTSASGRSRQGESVGIFIGDYFARSSKRSGAWMSAFRSQERLSGDIRPIIVNVMNFSKGRRPS